MNSVVLSLFPDILIQRSSFKLSYQVLAELYDRMNRITRKYLGAGLEPDYIIEGQNRDDIMRRVAKCDSCDGTGKESAPPGIHKKCIYCRGTGWVEHREIIRYGK